MYMKLVVKVVKAVSMMYLTVHVMNLPHCCKQWGWCREGTSRSGCNEQTRYAYVGMHM